MPNHPRIVSLLPSATEIVCALGAKEWLVGRSHECDFPAGVDSLPVLTSSRVDATQSSGEIDRAVKGLVSRDLSIFDVDLEQLKALRPTLILTQSLCAACAVSPRDLESVATECQLTDCRVLSSNPHCLEDVWLDMHAIGEALGLADRASLLVETLTARLDRVTSSLHKTDRQRVLAIEWIDPLMTAGNWVPELITRAGGEPILAPAGEHSEWISWEALMLSDPDAIVLMPCGFSLERTRAESQRLVAHPAWTRLRAVLEGRVFLTDGNQLFNRPGPRLVDSCEVLAEMLHPESKPRRHSIELWQPWSS